MQNFGLVRESRGRAVLRQIAVPKLQDDYILVRTVAIAINPTDWTTLDAKGEDGGLVGCDYAGIVEEVGPRVTRQFQKGDRIAGFAHGGNGANLETGAFARVIAVKGDLQMHIPDGVSFEKACTVGVGIATVGYGLYHVLKLPLPDGSSDLEARPIFIYGGSTATGTIAIQFARMSGMEVVTTCSPKHFDLVKRLGASHVCDYRTPGVGKQIREVTRGQISKVFDTVAVDSSAAICADACGPSGGVYCNLLGVECPRCDMESIFFLGYSLSGESYNYEGDDYDARPDDFVWGTKFATIAERLWAEGAWTAHPQRVGSGGLLGAIHGMQEMREGKVSGEKLVYRVEDTAWP